MGYEVIAAAIFSASLLWLSTRETVNENWRSFFFYLGFLDFILALGFSIIDADILRTGAIMTHFLAMLYIMGIQIFHKVGEMWAGSR